jgi:hypothetical protein
MATNGSFAQQEQYKNTTEQYPATSGATESSTGGASGNDLSKDEVGWYFVEQYYTTLSKSPEKLHVCCICPIIIKERNADICIVILWKTLSICLWT